jgi:hypothetical protein
MGYLQGNLSIRRSFFSGRLDISPRQKTSLQGVERGSIKISSPCSPCSPCYAFPFRGSEKALKEA